VANYDTLIVGAGHNGLVAAAYLAKGGRRVLVLEKREEVGGAAVSEELSPGYRFSTCADGSGYLAPEIQSDLGLAERGLSILPADPVVFAPLPDGNHLTIWRDSDRTAAEISAFSKRDAERYPDFVELMGRLAAVVGGLARITPPDLPDVGLSDLRAMLPLAGPLRGLGRKHLSDLLRILPVPVSDLLDEWFESDVVKGVIGASAVRDITWGPREAGTAYTFLYNWALSGNGLFRSAGEVKGGIGALSKALAAAATAAGAEIRSGSAVERLLVEAGRVSGVVLADGETIQAPLVVSAADPRSTFLEMLDPGIQSARTLKHVQNIKYRGSAARIHLALRDLPDFTGLPADEARNRLCGNIQIAPSLTYLQRAYDSVKYGEFSPRPYLDLRIPTLLDPGLSPRGHHILSITAKFAPYALREGSWETRGEAFTATVIDTLTEYVPKIGDLIVHQHVLTPADLEERFTLPEANPHHGEMTLDQFLHMRPIPGSARYRAPIPGLYLCGAGTHPGGNVTGLPGRNAAREILADAS